MNDFVADLESAKRSGLLGQIDSAIVVARYEWLTEDSEWTLPEYMMLSIRPLAKGHDGSFIAWQLNAGPMLFCPRDEEFAVQIGNTLGDALFWILLEELQSSWVPPEAPGATVWRMAEWLPRLEGLVEEIHLRELQALLKKPVVTTRSGARSVMSAEAHRKILLHYPDKFGGRFRQYREIGG